MTAVSLATSAVPVMAGIVSARRMERTAAGPLSPAAAVVTHSVGWLLLTAAICLDAGSLTGLLRCVQALCLGLVCVRAIRCGLLSRPARSVCGRAPHSTAVLLGAVAVAVALAMEHLGMTAVLGAALVGLSTPAKRSAPWHRAVVSVSRAGRALVPAFFVVTGVTVFNGSFSAAPWSLTALALALGVLGKTAGGYFGARLGGQSRQVSRQVGVLMNTRGLTELIVLQVGYSTGILTAPLVLALVVMALVTTAMTGPLLSLLERAGVPSQPHRNSKPPSETRPTDMGTDAPGRRFHRDPDLQWVQRVERFTAEAWPIRTRTPSQCPVLLTWRRAVAISHFLYLLRCRRSVLLRRFTLSISRPRATFDPARSNQFGYVSGKGEVHRANRQGRPGIHRRQSPRPGRHRSGP
ncbi:cation:proton antiporter [Streptomyces sp. NPDC056831]|uniref:cation:proton antiporter n=1 Tax=Streptomyces sp. NPDC056831 TaxID=3345954 RepID=UPI0036C928DA